MRALIQTTLVIAILWTPAQALAQFHLATGLGGAWAIQDDYGEEPYFRFRGELPVYAYLPVYKPVFVRGGLRLAYTESQPEMPGAVKIEETDFAYTFEAAAVLDWYVMPSLGFGWGMINRTIKLKSSGKLDVDDDKISGKETLSFWQAQFGLGVPMLDGLIVLEPFARYWNIKGDNRSDWSLGFDVTMLVY